MNKDFTHVRRIGFLLGAFDEDPDQASNLTANKIISRYNHGQETPGLTMAQKNRIDTILTIRDFEYIIYHTDLSLPLGVSP